MALGDDQHAADLDTYLSKNRRFRSFFYDHREIRCIAYNLGFNPDHVRTGLRKLGYCLIKIEHGRMFWKRGGASVQVLYCIHESLPPPELPPAFSSRSIF
jgi:hypothetical protein